MCVHPNLSSNDLAWVLFPQNVWQQIICPWTAPFSRKFPSKCKILKLSSPFLPRLLRFQQKVINLHPMDGRRLGSEDGDAKMLNNWLVNFWQVLCCRTESWMLLLWRLNISHTHFCSNLCCALDADSRTFHVSFYFSVVGLGGSHSYGIQNQKSNLRHPHKSTSTAAINIIGILQVRLRNKVLLLYPVTDGKHQVNWAIN